MKPTENDLKEEKFSCTNSFGFTNNECEKMSISINTKLAPNFVLEIVYRHLNDNLKDFTKHFNDTLQKINMKNFSCVILGDFNSNILHLKNEPAASNISMLKSHGLFCF